MACDKAIDLAVHDLDERYKIVSSFYEDIVSFLKEYSKVHINNTDKSIPYTLNFSVVGVPSRKFVELLDQRGICVSAKTSCCPLETPSKLVFALTKDKKLASSSIRISFSHMTTWEEIDIFKDVFDSLMKELDCDGEV